MTDVFEIYQRGVRALLLRTGSVIRTSVGPTPFVGLPGILYSGVLFSAGPYTEGDILGLGNQESGTSPSVSLSVVPVVQHVIHAWPQRFGTLTAVNFFLGTLGFPGDMTETQTGLLVNGEPYRVGRSDHLLNATIPGAGGTLPLVVA